jgi:hypothetical protein
MDELEEDVKESIRDSLKPLLEKARKENLIFRSCYRGVILTPAELEERQGIGLFLWGPASWQLISADEIKDTLKSKMEEAEKAYISFLSRLQGHLHQNQMMRGVNNG